MMRGFIILLCGAVFVLPASARAEAAKKDAPAAKPAEGEAPAAEHPALEPGADFICEADVFYNWKPQDFTPKKILPADPKPKEEEAVVPPPESIREFFTTVGEQGVVEEEVTNRLNVKIPLLQRQAAEHCKQTHQDQTLCVSAKLRAGFEQYNKLDYISRRAMVEAMTADCLAKMGKCLDTEVSEIECHINRSPEVPIEKAGEAGKEAGKDAGKDAGKEKKK